MYIYTKILVTGFIIKNSTQVKEKKKTDFEHENQRGKILLFL